MKKQKEKKSKTVSEALILNTLIGFGDCLYMTPLIKMLSEIYDGIDIWCFNEEPFLGNPHVRNIFKISNSELPTPWDFYFDNIYKVPIVNLDKETKQEHLRTR